MVPIPRPYARPPPACGDRPAKCGMPLTTLASQQYHLVLRLTSASAASPALQASAALADCADGVVVTVEGDSRVAADGEQQ